MFSFGGEEDGDEFLLPSGGNSKLASLFGADASGSPSSNESLKYTAPKEPKKTQTAAPSASGLLCASAVHAYKYIDGKYSSQGKLGAAVIGTHSPPDYKLLLYVSKQQQVTFARISSAFTFTVQPNHYANFYDDARNSWSIMFDSEQNLLLFAKQIALAKANATEGAMDAVVSQDLFLPPEGSPLELGDSVEVRFTGWLFNEGTAGEVFETNTSSEKLLRCKLGKGKIIKGHEEGLLGMKKGGKRLLVIPPQLGYGSDGKQGVPSNATLVIESEIVRVKHMKDKGKSTPQSSRSTTPVPKEEEEEDEADGRKSRTKSITESISDQLTTQPNKSDKAKLISRMAKMGQPMLPRGSIGHDDHEVPTTPGSVEGKPDIPIKPATVNQTHEGVAYSQPPSAAAQPVVGGYPPQYIQPMAAQQPPLAPPTVMQGIPNGNQMALYQSSMQQPGYPPAPYNAIYGQQPYQAAPPPAPPSTDTPVLLSETRQQNTEVRLCLSKVSDKVDRIMEKVDHMHSQQQQIAQPNTSYNMETSALMHNIQRIVQENERLKKEVFEKSSRIESQNDKISDLLHRNQKFMEQSNVLLEQRNDSFKSTATQSQARVLTLEQEKVELSSRLSAVTSEVGVLQLELTAVKKVAAESQLQLQKSLGEEEKYREQINKDKLTSSENDRLIEKLTSELKEERQLRRVADSQITSLQDEMAEVKVNKAAAEKAKISKGEVVEEEEGEAEGEENLAEKKKKSAEEKKGLEGEIEDLKTQHETEVVELKEKIRHTKSSTDAASAQKVKELEAELNKDWEEKCQRQVKNAQEKHARELNNVREEKNSLEEKIKALEAKLTQLKSSKGSNEQQVLALQDELEEFKVWKQKYEKLRSQATAMKEKYEAQISEAEQERDEAMERMKQVQAKARDVMQQRSAPSADVEAQVKKIMSSVFHSLKEKFSAKEKYEGEKVCAEILAVIKKETLKLMKPKDEEDEEEEDEEEEEEVEEEDGGEDAIVKEEIKSEKVIEDQVKVEKEELRTDKEKVVEMTTEKKVEENIQQEDKNPIQEDVAIHEEAAIQEEAPKEESEEEVCESECSVRNAIAESTEVETARNVNPEHLTKEEEADEQSTDEDLNTSNSLALDDGRSSSLDRSIHDIAESDVSAVSEGEQQDKDGEIGNREEQMKKPEELENSRDEPMKSGENDEESEDEMFAPHSEEEEEEEEEEEVEDEVTACSAAVTGDRGNPHYAAELEKSGDPGTKKASEQPTAKRPQQDQAEMLADIEAQIQPKTCDTMAGILKSVEDMIVPNEPKASPIMGAIHQSVEDIVVPTQPESSPILGAIHQSVEDIVVPTQSESSPILGAIHQSVEDIIVPTQPESSPILGAIHQSVEDIIVPTQPESSPILGAIHQSVEDIIVPNEPKSSSIMGAIHQSVEDTVLPSEPKSFATMGAIQQSIEEMILPSTTASNAAAKKPIEESIRPSVDQSGTSTKKKETEEMIQPVKAKVTGDKGNAHYAKELETGAKDQVMPEKAYVTGDKGNIHYAKELEANKDVRPKSSKPSKDSKKEKVTAKEGKALEREVEEMIVPASAQGNTAEKKREEKIKPQTQNALGDKGNVHYAKDLEKGSLEDSIAGMLEPFEKGQKKGDKIEKKGDKIEKKGDKIEKKGDKIEKKGDKIEKKGDKIEKKGDKIEKKGDKIEKKGDKKEEKITPKKSHPTGDKGNIHYSKELAKDDAQLLDSVEACIVPKAKAHQPKPSTVKPKDKKTTLFDGASDEDDLFAAHKTDSKKSKPKAKVEFTDDMKPTPPPLFEDSDDDKDLDWLS